MELFEAIKNRRSIRKFKKDSVPADILNKITDAAMYAPSTKNKQARRLLVIEGLDKINKITELMRRSTINAKKEEEREYIERANNPNYTVNYGAPLFIITLADKGVNAEADCAVMLQNMFLAAHGCGIGSVWINQLNPISDTKEMRAFLNSCGVPENYIICGCGAFGYNDGYEAKQITYNKAEQIITVNNIME